MRSKILFLLALPFMISPASAQIDSDFSAGGGIKIGTSTSTCNAAAEGAIRYNSVNKTPQYCDGTSWISAVANDVYDIGMFTPGRPASSGIVRVVLPRAVTFPTGLTNSQCKAKTAATASTTVTLKKNTTSIGTAVWAASGTSCTFTFSGAVSFAAGDILEFAFPGTADSTLADVTITLAGTKS